MASPGKKRTAKAHPRRKHNFGALDKAVENALDDYFRMLVGYRARRLHKLVFDRVEKKVIEYVLNRTGFNQSRAADLLGLSRSTLRSKIRAHGVSLRGKQPRKKA